MTLLGNLSLERKPLSDSILNNGGMWTDTIDLFGQSRYIVLKPNSLKYDFYSSLRIVVSYLPEKLWVQKRADCLSKMVWDQWNAQSVTSLRTILLFACIILSFKRNSVLFAPRGVVCSQNSDHHPPPPKKLPVKDRQISPQWAHDRNVSYTKKTDLVAGKLVAMTRRGPCGTWVQAHPCPLDHSGMLPALERRPFSGRRTPGPLELRRLHAQQVSPPGCKHFLTVAMQRNVVGLYRVPIYSEY